MVAIEEVIRRAVGPLLPSTCLIAFITVVAVAVGGP